MRCSRPTPCRIARQTKSFTNTARCPSGTVAGGAPPNGVELVVSDLPQQLLRACLASAWGCPLSVGRIFRCPRRCTSHCSSLCCGSQRAGPLGDCCAAYNNGSRCGYRPTSVGDDRCPKSSPSTDSRCSAFSLTGLPVTWATAKKMPGSLATPRHCCTPSSKPRPTPRRSGREEERIA